MTIKHPEQDSPDRNPPESALPTYTVCRDAHGKEPTFDGLDMFQCNIRVAHRMLADEINKFFERCDRKNTSVSETLDRMGLLCPGTPMGNDTVTVQNGKDNFCVGVTVWADFIGRRYKAFCKSDSKEQYTMEMLVKKF